MKITFQKMGGGSNQDPGAMFFAGFYVPKNLHKAYLWGSWKVYRGPKNPTCIELVKGKIDPATDLVAGWVGFSFGAGFWSSNWEAIALFLSFCYDKTLGFRILGSSHSKWAGQAVKDLDKIDWSLDKATG